MIRTHDAGSLRAEHVGQSVTLAGWVARRRDHGGVAFIDLRGGLRVVQVVIRDEEVAHHLRSEYCLKITGAVSARPGGQPERQPPDGEVEVIAEHVEVLSATRCRCPSPSTSTWRWGGGAPGAPLPRPAPRRASLPPCGCARA